MSLDVVGRVFGVLCYTHELHPMIRMVDSSGNISFAAVEYRVGSAYRRQQVQARVVGDTVESKKWASFSRPTPSNTTRPALSESLPAS